MHNLLLLAAVLLARKMADLTHVQCKNGAMSHTRSGTSVIIPILWCQSRKTLGTRLIQWADAFSSPEPFSLLAVTRGKIGSGIND